jgi:hypothetical protein
MSVRLGFSTINTVYHSPVLNTIDVLRRSGRVHQVSFVQELRPRLAWGSKPGHGLSGAVFSWCRWCCKHAFGPRVCGHNPVLDSPGVYIEVLHLIDMHLAHQTFVNLSFHHLAALSFHHLAALSFHHLAALSSRHFVALDTSNN